MKFTHRILSLTLIICVALISCAVPVVFAESYPEEGIVWDFNCAEAVSEANSAVATAACGTITADTDFVNSYSVSASFTTNATRRMQIKLPNNVIQQKNESGEYVYNYLHILVGNPQNNDVTFGCGINTTSPNTQLTLKANSWTVASFYIEDLFLAGNSNYKRDGKNYANSVQGVAFQMSDQVAGANTTNAGIKYNLDKVWVTANPLPSFELDSITPENGYSHLSPVDTEIKFTFKRNLKESDSFILSDAFTSSDGSSADARVKIKGKSLFVKAEDVLSKGTSYSLNLGEVLIKDCYGTVYSQNPVFNFTSLNKPVVSGNLRAEDENGNEVYYLPDEGCVNLSARALNVSSSAETAVIASTVVNKLSGEAVFSVASSCELSAEMTSPAVLDSLCVNADGNSFVYALVLNSLSDAQPLAPAYFVLSTDTEESGMVYCNSSETDFAAIELDEPSLNVDTLTVSGSVSVPESLVLVGIRRIADGAPTFLMPIKAKHDGSFLTQYVFGNSESGKYKVFASAYGNPDGAECEIVYLGEETKEEIRSSFDGDISVDDAYKLINNYRDGMGIPSSYSKAMLEHAASVLCEQKPYAGYPDVINTINKAAEALESLNSSTWSSYAECFEKYDIILNDTADLDGYFKYDERGKAEIHKLASEKSPFANFIDLRKALCDAEKAYTKKLENSQKPSGGASSGGSSSSSRPSGSSSGGFSGSAVSISPAPSGTDINESAKAPVADTYSGNAEFGDVSESHWAYSALNELTKRNIISGYTNGTFCGDNNVSRAEFVKILTGVFGFAEGKGTRFTDVKSGVWYEEFLNRASFAGIVKGTDGKFMPDEFITRQDAALMLYRSLQYKSFSLNGSKDFVDSDAVSDYALDAVSKMGASGLISGYGDGSFAPDRNITRFEAVQLLYNAMKYISGGAK